MNAESTEEKVCPKCGAATPLPYMCRACWSALTTEGKIRFYHSAGNGTARRAGKRIPMVQQ